MKVDIKEIAQRLSNRGIQSHALWIEEAVTDAILESINPQLVKLTEQVIEEMQDLERPGPRNAAEYNERFGLNKE